MAARRTSTFVQRKRMDREKKPSCTSLSQVIIGPVYFCRGQYITRQWRLRIFITRVNIVSILLRVPRLENRPRKHKRHRHLPIDCVREEVREDCRSTCSSILSTDVHKMDSERRCFPSETVARSRGERYLKKIIINPDGVLVCRVWLSQSHAHLPPWT